MTNSIIIIALISTNWVSTGTFTDNLGRRFEEQDAYVRTNIVARTITVVTNDVILSSGTSVTNGVSRRLPVLPPLPSKLGGDR